MAPAAIQGNYTATFSGTITYKYKLNSTDATWTTGLTPVSFGTSAPISR